MFGWPARDRTPTLVEDLDDADGPEPTSSVWPDHLMARRPSLLVPPEPRRFGRNVEHCVPIEAMGRQLVQVAVIPFPLRYPQGVTS